MPRLSWFFVPAGTGQGEKGSSAPRGAQAVDDGGRGAIQARGDG